MGVQYSVTHLGCCSNSTLHHFSAIITSHTDLNITSDSKKFSILKKGIGIEGEKTIETS